MLPELPAFPCPHCHERAFSKRPVAHDDAVSAGTLLAHVYLCHACGEDYGATVHVGADRSRTETWDYYLERSRSLRMVRHYEPSGAYHLAESDPVFAIDGEIVTEDAWTEALAATREAPSPILDAAPADAPARLAFAERWLAWWSATLRPHGPDVRVPGPALSSPFALGTTERRAA